MNVYNKQQFYKTLKAYKLFAFFKLYAVRETIAYYGRGFQQCALDNVINNHILIHYQGKSTKYIINDLKKRQRAFIKFNNANVIKYIQIPQKDRTYSNINWERIQTALNFINRYDYD